MIDDNIEWTFVITVQPGQTVELGAYTIQAADEPAALAAADALLTPTAFGGQASAYLSSDDLSGLVNFQFAPNVTINGAPAESPEGTAISLTRTVTDGDVNTPTYAWTVTKDGVVFGTVGTASTFSFTPDDNATYVVTLAVTNSLDETGTATATIVVTNVAPTAAIGNNGPVNEGSSFTVTLSSPVDPSTVDASSLHYVFSTSAASRDAATYNSGSSTSNTADFPTTDNGAVIVYARVLDKDGDFTDYQTTVTVNNVAPTIALTGAPSVNEGSSYTLNLGAITDPGMDTVTSYTITWGDGVTENFIGSPVGLSKTHIFADGTTNYSIEVSLTDEDGSYASAGTQLVTVNNVAPTIALSGASSVNEGSSYTLNLGSITDPGADTVTAYSINWGDGVTENFTGNPVGVNKTHTYADGAATFSIVVSLTDEDGSYVSAGTQGVTVKNVAPTIALSGSLSVDEGSLYTLNLGAITDPGTDTVTAYSINWGFGIVDSFTGSPVGLSKTHTFADGSSSTLTIVVSLTDEDGTYEAGAQPVTVNNVAPTIALSGVSSVNEGSSFTLNLGSITDPGTDTVTAYSIAWGDGVTENFTGNPTGLSKTHTYADGINTYIIRVSLTDEDGSYNSAGTQSVTVNNVAPTIALSGASSVNEGSVYTLNLGSIIDPGADTVTGYSICWGDGVTENFTGNPVGVAKAHTYATGTANYSITVSLTDEDGSYAAAGTTSVLVNDVAPIIALSGAASVNEGSPYSLNLGSITDPGSQSVSAYTINWGDGCTELFTGNPSGLTRTHLYADGRQQFMIAVSLDRSAGCASTSGYENNHCEQCRSNHRLDRRAVCAGRYRLHARPGNNNRSRCRHRIGLLDQLGRRRRRGLQRFAGRYFAVA